jgi:tetratricopeptide (TPR) repeat protein
MHQTDVIKKPAHYTAGSIEVKDYLKSWSLPVLGTFPGFPESNAIKYLFRYPYKGSSVQDLEKAIEYLKWAIDDLDSKNFLQLALIRCLRLVGNGMNEVKMVEAWKLPLLESYALCSITRGIKEANTDRYRDAIVYIERIMQRERLHNA